MANASLDPIDILLELGFDLDDISDDESYLSAMKEAIATIEFKTQGKGDDRSRALREEVIKVTRQRRSKRTVDVNKVFKTKPKASTAVGPKLLAASKDYKEQKEEEEKQEKAVTAIIPAGLKRVSDGINDITKVLVRDLTAEKKQADEERKAAENLAAETEEKESEKQSQESAGNFLKGLKPPEIPFFDRIKRFFQNVLVGGLLGWLAKPENQDKVKGFADFIRDHGGKILTGILALVALDVGMKLLGFLKIFTPLIKGLWTIFTNPLFMLALTGLMAGRQAAINYEEDLRRQEQENKEEDEVRAAQGLPELTQEEKESRRTFDEVEAAAPAFAGATGGDVEAARAGGMFGGWLSSLFRGGGKEYADNELGRAEKEKDRVSGEIKKTEQYIARLTKMLEDPAVKGGFRSNTEASLERAQEKLKKLKNDLEYAESRMEEYAPEAAPTSQEIEKQIIDSTKEGGLYEGHDPSTLQWNSQLGIPEPKTPTMDTSKVAKPERPEGTDAPVLPQGAEPANEEFLENLKANPSPAARTVEKLFSTPPQPMQVSVLPVSVPAQKPQVASSSAGQKTAPTFGSVDPNNTSVPMIAGVYNSPVAV